MHAATTCLKAPDRIERRPTMKNTTFLFIAALPFTTACLDLDFSDISGLGEAFGNWEVGGFGGSGWGGGYTATLTVSGSVTVGPYPATAGEATVLLYAEADSTNPVDSVEVSGGEYAVSFGTNPTADQCAYVAQARRWDGEVSPMVSLFADPPADCAVGGYAGSTLKLPKYEPLATPFRIRGRMLVDGQPVGAGRAQAYAFLDRGPSLGRIGPATTDDDGWYTIETTDQAIWFAACRHVRVEISSGAVLETVELYDVPLERCSESRTMPDVRHGSAKAATGWLLGGPNYEQLDLGAYEIVVELHPIADTLSAPVPGQVLDDGSYHVWFPDGVSPGCDWDVVVYADGVPTASRSLNRYGWTCEPPYHLDLEVTPGSPSLASHMSVAVVDPVGDHKGLTDVTSMRLDFDGTSGEYRITIEATEAAMFQDSIRVNVNLFNPEAGTFFSHTMADARIDPPTTTLTLSGWSAAVRHWLPGQSVHTNSLEGTPNPPNTTLYRSSVNHFPLGFLTNEDVIAFEDLAAPAIVVEHTPE